jgi:hypothetical protein
LGRRPSRRPSSTRRAGFYAADMSDEIILLVIWQAGRSIADRLTARSGEPVITRGGCRDSIIRRSISGTGCAKPAGAIKPAATV